jgi:hypothetical protein
MYKTIALVGFLALVWIGYVAWPLYDLFALVRAIEDRNISTVTRHVDFGRVRASLTNQVIAAYVRRTGIVITPRQQQMAAAVSIADPIVSKLITPEALSDFLAAGWPLMVMSDPPPNTIGIDSNTIGTIRQVFVAAEYGVGRFEVAAPVVLPPAQRFGLTFRLLNWRWRLVGMVLPEHIRDLFADELIKALRK